MAHHGAVARRERRVQGVPVYARLLSVSELERAGVRVARPLLCCDISVARVGRPEAGQNHARRRLVHRVRQRDATGRSAAHTHETIPEPSP